MSPNTSLAGAPLFAPPHARPGLQALPGVGPLIAGIATAQSPIAQALRCRAKEGDVFTIEMPGSAPTTFVLGTRGHQFMNRLPTEAAGIGQVLSLVSVLSQWVPRSDRSPEHLERLAIGGRAFLAHRLRRADATSDLHAIVDTMVEDATRSWEGTIDLAQAIIALVHSISLRCIGGLPAWSHLGDRGRAHLRGMASGIDVPRLPLGATPLRFFMSDYWASRRFQRALRALVEAHERTGEIELIDDLLATMSVGGGPLDARDRVWALNYVLFNAVAYPGSYGFWSFVDIMNDRDVSEAIRGASKGDAEMLAEHAVLETIRLNPVTVAGRMLKQDVHYPAGERPSEGHYVIPKGTLLGSAPASYTRDPQEHKAPDSYCPHRFSEGESVPKLFGGGAFGCVAQRYTRALLPAIHAALIRRFTFQPIDPTPPRLARPALHYPKKRLRAIVVARDSTSAGGATRAAPRCPVHFFLRAK